MLRAPKTAELIAAQLRRRIVKGDLAVGETLPPEPQLMQQFGVSRPTLREAFRILEAETLIDVRRGSRGGAQVLDPDPSVATRHVGLLLQLQGTSVKDVYQARTVTEPACAGMLARVRTPQDVADLRAVIEQLREIIDAGFDAVPDAATWAGTTYRFHELILQRCGNNTLAVQGAVLADIVQTHLMRVVTRGMSNPHTRSPGRHQVLLGSFVRLVDLIEEGSAEEAEAHWRNHMQVAGEQLFLGTEGSTPVVDLFG